MMGSASAIVAFISPCGRKKCRTNLGSVKEPITGLIGERASPIPCNSLDGVSGRNDHFPDVYGTIDRFDAHLAFLEPDIAKTGSRRQEAGEIPNLRIYIQGLLDRIIAQARQSFQ